MPAPSPIPAAAPPRAGPRALLFTAFEPSGDDLASVVIAELRRRDPDRPVYAWGGSKMESAGATVVERTGGDAVMGMPGLEKIREHRRINRRIADWLDGNPVVAHVPVDSPAANFPICALSKERGIRVVHLAAPQIWAWGRWRIHKLRRLTDLVLCLLPFEERFFTRRDVHARFIGHPMFDRAIDAPALAARSAGFPAGTPRVALMPGSRPAEISRCWPLVLRTFHRLKRDFPGIAGVVATTHPAIERGLRESAPRHGGWPDNLSVVPDDIEAVIHWCDAAIVKSGTTTLQLTRFGRPMVMFYPTRRLQYYLLGKWIVSTKFFGLPNLIAGREIVPELIPHFGGYEPLYEIAADLLRSPTKMQTQREELASIVDRFRNRHAAADAADAIEEIARSATNR